jgi:predicted molibdopterin-dependent oxidoreductase YjgC
MHKSEQNLRLAATERGPVLAIEVDGRHIEAHAGETVAAVLLANGIRVLRHTDESGAPRGVFCGIGVCFDCLVTVDGVPNVRACVTPVRQGMIVETGAISGV